MSKSRILVSMVASGVLSSVAIADGYEPVGKGFVAPPTYRWTGFYVGGNIGAAAFDNEARDDDEEASLGIMNNDGFAVIGGLKGGYDYQFGNAVIGIVGEYSWTNFDESYTTGYCNENTTRSTKINGIASLRARAGLASGNTLMYVTGGAAWIDRDDKLLCLDNGVVDDFISDDTVTALVVGAGAEMFVTNQVTIGLEYLYYEAEDETVRGTNFAIDPNDLARFDMTAQTLTFNLNYRFGN